MRRCVALPPGSLACPRGVWQVRVRTTHPAAAGNRSDASSVDSDVLLLRTGAAHTRWLELLRVSEGGATAPDFLADHNSGDFKGDTAFLSTCGTNCGFYNFRVGFSLRFLRVLELSDNKVETLADIEPHIMRGLARWKKVCSSDAIKRRW